MTIHTGLWLHHGHLTHPSTDPSQLSNAINACLCKAEALTTVAAFSNFDSCNDEALGNYLWALHDLVSEAKFLYGKLERVDKSNV